MVTRIYSVSKKISQTRMARNMIENKDLLIVKDPTHQPSEDTN